MRRSRRAKLVASDQCEILSTSTDFNHVLITHLCLHSALQCFSELVSPYLHAVPNTTVTEALRTSDVSDVQVPRPPIICVLKEDLSQKKHTSSLSPFKLQEAVRVSCGPARSRMPSTCVVPALPSCASFSLFVLDITTSK